MTDAPTPGIARELENGLRVILAPNPSPMTHWGTNTYIIGERSVAVVDPGPDDPRHFSAILDATRGARISHILVTHAHRDHSPLARALAEDSGAPVLAFGSADAGRTPVMEQLAVEGLVGGGEGVDEDFSPDRSLVDGEVVDGEGWHIESIHTPGHMAGHLSFRVGNAVLSGDQVMGWASTLISPPDGDLTAFMTSCARLKTLGAEAFHPGHGAPLNDPADRLEWLIDHRRSREAAILAALSDSPARPRDIAQRVYNDISPILLPAATRNVLAHLIDLHVREVVNAAPQLSESALFSVG